MKIYLNGICLADDDDDDEGEGGGRDWNRGWIDRERTTIWLLYMFRFDELSVCGKRDQRVWVDGE